MTINSVSKRSLFVTGILAFPLTAHAVSVSATDDADALALAAFGAGSGITIVDGSAALQGAETQQGTFTDFSQGPGSAEQPTLTLGDGIVLTSGSVEFDTTTNTLNNFSANSGSGSFQPLVDLAAANGLSTTQRNANVLSFDFILDDPDANSVEANFVFATDEFPTQSVTDIMGVFVNGENFAFFPNGDLVSNQSGDPNDFFNANPVGTSDYGMEWNGFTDTFDLTMLADGGGAVNTMQIAVSDTSDTIFDSALFFTGTGTGTTTGVGGIDPNPDPGVIPLPAAGWVMIAGLGTFGLLKRRRA